MWKGKEINDKGQRKETIWEQRDAISKTWMLLHVPIEFISHLLLSSTFQHLSRNISLWSFIQQTPTICKHYALCQKFHNKYHMLPPFKACRVQWGAHKQDSYALSLLWIKSVTNGMTFFSIRKYILFYFVSFSRFLAFTLCFLDFSIIFRLLCISRQQSESGVGCSWPK